MKKFNLRFQAVVLAGACLLGSMPAYAVEPAPTTTPSWAWAKTLPSRIVEPSEFFAAQREQARVICIVDPADNQFRQLSIARSLDLILKKTQAKDVFLDGAVSGASLAYLRQFAPLNARKAVGKDFLMHGLIGGAEYLSLVSDIDFNLRGEEDAWWQAQVLVDAATLQKNAEKLTTYLRRLENAVEALKPVLLSSEAKQLDLRRGYFRAGQMDSVNYRDYLKGVASENGVKWSNEGVEIPEMESTLFRALARTPDAKKLVEVMLQLEGLKNLLSLNNYTSGGPVGVSALEKSVSFLNAQLLRAGLFRSNLPPVPEERYREMLLAARRFERTSLKRDSIFLNRMLRRVRASGRKEAVLVLDSRRLSSFKKQLREKNASYVVLAPRATAWTTGKRSNPIRTQLAFDLAADREPVIWKLQEALGLEPGLGIQLLVGAFDSNTLALYQRIANQKPALSWFRFAVNRYIRKKPNDKNQKAQWKAADQLVLEAQNRFDQRFEESKYRSYLAFAEQNSVEQIGPVEKMLRKYEQNLEKFTRQIEAGSDRWSDTVGDLSAVFMEAFKETKLQPDMGFNPDEGALRATVRFLTNNVTETGMPLSYRAPIGYWERYHAGMDDVDAILERLLVQNGLSIYDGALWQIALGIQSNPRLHEQAEKHSRRLLEGRSGMLNDIRAYGPGFLYGDQEKVFNRDEAFFFRFIADSYLQSDPKDGKLFYKNFPNFDRLHHEDWKPIMGEQAWGAIIGPLQTAYLRDGDKLYPSTPEMKLALSIIPAVEAMASPIGAIYHSPKGTHQKNSREISNENNFSMYSALRMLELSLADRAPGRTATIHRLWTKQEEYFKRYAFDTDGQFFYQGGYYYEGRFVPNRIFAADCQTWGILAMGPAWIDREFGPGTSYGIWKTTKARAGHFDEAGLFEGFGFTDGHESLSIEWTCGAILAAAQLFEQYRDSNPEWAQEIKTDLMMMRQAMEKYRVKVPGGANAYLYANGRYFIPFGWWANPIPSLASSAWIVLIDQGFNPFVLGGGSEFRRGRKPSYYQPMVSAVATPAEPVMAASKVRSVFFAKPKISPATRILKPTPTPAPAPKPVVRNTQTVRPIVAGKKPATSEKIVAIKPVTPQSNIAPKFMLSEPLFNPTAFVPARLFQGEVEEAPLPDDTNHHDS